MKKRTFQTTGTINNNGGLNLYMDDLNAFFRQHKGERVFATFEIIPRGTSEALKAYYYKVVVPTFRKAIWDAGERKTMKDTELFLREISPIMIEEESHQDGKWYRKLKDISEVSNAELVEHIETLKQIAAEEYNVFIEDPNTI